MHRSTLVLVVALASGAVTTPARAAPAFSAIFAAPKAAASARKNIAVGRFEGPKSSKIRLALMQELKDSSSFSVTDAEDLKATAGKSAIAKMASALQVDAVMLGTVSKNNDLTISVYKPDGRLVNHIKVKGGSSTKLATAVDKEFDSTIAPPLALASGATLGGAVEEEAEPAPAPPPPAEPAAEEAKEGGEDTADDAKESEPKADDAKSAPSKAGRTPFELTAGVRGYSRNFKYTDLQGVRDPSKPRTLRPYQLGFAPALLVNGVFYPGAFLDDGVLGNIGIMGGAELGIATLTDYEQQLPDGSKNVTTLQTTVRAWDLGLRGRIPLGPGELALFAEFGQQSFILLGDEGGAKLGPLVPDVQYTFVRLGAEGRVRLGKFLLGGHIAPRILTSLHQLDLATVWFPGAKGWGLDFGLMVGYAVAPFLDIVGGADFVGYGFDFNDIPNDATQAPILAGGATDRYNSLWLGLRLGLGGSNSKD